MSVVQKYSYNVPGQFIWFSHLTYGILFILLASLYLGFKEANDPRKNTVSDVTAYILIVMGTLAIVYHMHLWIASIYWS